MEAIKDDIVTSTLALAEQQTPTHCSSQPQDDINASFLYIVRLLRAGWSHCWHITTHRGLILIGEAKTEAIKVVCHSLGLFSNGSIFFGFLGFLTDSKCF